MRSTLTISWPDLKETKNGTPRSVPLMDAVIQELKILFKDRNPAKARVFASKTAFGALDISKPWNTVLKETNIENFVFHGIRHHFATLAARSGGNYMQILS